jgi:hypothetical protein
MAVEELEGKQKTGIRDIDLPSNRRLSKGARSYLLGRGISSASIEKYSICEGTILNPPTVGRIIFPIFRAGAPVYWVGRTYRKRDRRTRYLYPKGVERKSIVFDCFGTRVGWVFLTEGVIDVIKLDQAGFPAAALLGSSLSNQQRGWVLNRASRGVVLIGDADAWDKWITIQEKFAPYLDTEMRWLWHGDVGERDEDEIIRVASFS